MLIKMPLRIKEFNTERMIHIYHPDDVFTSNKRYPVLYMFDGHNLFLDEDATYGKSWNLHSHIINNHKDLIVVGQECNHNGNRRINEYSPYSFFNHEMGYIHGDGRLTMEFFIHTLKPFVDEKLPTLPDRDHTYIGGSSCGGIMALYAGIVYSKYFSKALCLSPFLMPFTQRLIDEIKTKNNDPSCDFYLSWGAKEFKEHQLLFQTKAITQISNQLTAKGHHTYLEFKENGHHCEEDWEKEIDGFLEFLQR